MSTSVSDPVLISETVIATSGPSGTFPQLAYRNPLSALVRHLDKTHGAQWAIWEFRGEGTGYPDAAVYNRIYHYPWPDHQPPPFAYIPKIMASMRNWLQGGAVAAFESPALDTSENRDKIGDDDGNDTETKRVEKTPSSTRVVVIHCKAGKGRTGTVVCSYLMSERNYSLTDALTTFTSKRMRPGFGDGVSIPSQLRWASYVDRWRRDLATTGTATTVAMGRKYVDSPTEIHRVRIWGLKDGVTCSVRGYADRGQLVTYHTFSSEEIERRDLKRHDRAVVSARSVSGSGSDDGTVIGDTDTTTVAVLTPDKARPIVLPSSDVLLCFVKRSRSAGLTNVVTAVAHTWFNTYFEGDGPEQSGTPDDRGTFVIVWEAMDGLKGTTYRGSRAFVKVAVEWHSRLEEAQEIDSCSIDDVSGLKS